jgi:hypothetical protein
MIADKKEFGKGMILMVAFLAVLAVVFMPVFDGQNGLNYLDSLYNSISKGSAYYIPQMKEEASKFQGKMITVNLKCTDENQARQTADLLNAAGAMVNVNAEQVKVSGDLGAILKQSLEDADLMYHNDENAVTGKYGYPGRRALYNWWSALKGMNKALSKQELFEEAAVISMVQQKAVECAYNYFGIVPESISDKVWIVLSSLVFYVIYTLWYGYAILFMFEGWGLQLEDH